MRTLLVVTALSMLSASAAEGRPWAAYHCGKLQIAMLPMKYFLPLTGCIHGACDGKTHYFDMEKDPDDKRPLSGRSFRYNDDGELLYKGRKCREFDDNEYEAR
jgi:hypothetical protein